MPSTHLIPFILILLLAAACQQGTTPDPAPTGTDSAAYLAEPQSTPTDAPALAPLAPSPSPSTITTQPLPVLADLPISSSPSRPCPVPLTGGLISELRPILAAIPGPGSEGMRLPSDVQMVAWEFLVRSMDAGDVDTACQVLSAFDFPYTLLDFTDLPADGARYLALVEDRPVTYGWGTYVLRLGPPGSETVSEAVSEAVSKAVIQVPHPLADDRTALQGADLFRRLEGRALMIAGAHRCANSDYSPCSGATVACGSLEPYRSSDVAHAAQTAFQAAHKALLPCGGDRLAIQLHGNGLASCPDLFISNGTLNPRRTALELYASAARRCTGFSVDLADGVDGECAFNGGATLQAVYSNGCDLNPPVDACGGYAEFAPEREGFIFLEQSMRMRWEYGCLVKALEEVVGE